MSAQNNTVSADSGGSSGETATGGDRKADHDHRPDRVAQELPLDVIFEIIRNRRRRLVLQCLDESDSETLKLSELSEHIAAIENDTTEEALSAQQRKRVYVGLYQCHLPKMADSGVVEFDKNRGTVSEGPNVEQLDPYLDVDERADDDSRQTLLLGSAAVVGYALAAFGGVPGIVAGGLVVVASLLGVAWNGMR
ncbi:hypothetical protein SAMN05192554_11573 [Haloarchaeobius iranensis]|uniref:DUF7344 domain-containing protein n=1 Tax=Haloarchaeobius iranensis TaxID=996166 RepID=A0A1G9YPJ5_9EURY|nr:hypothetical protein SAMN05192554_11573 [Haloarchaeobius iranensis]